MKRFTAICILLSLAFIPMWLHAGEVAPPEPGSPLEQVLVLIDAINDNDARVTINEAQLADHDAQIADNDARITSLEALAVTLASRATSLESRAAAVEGRALSLEGRATSLEGRATAVEGSVITLGTRATGLEVRAATIEDRLDILETEPPAVISGAFGTLNTWGIGSFLITHRADLPLSLIEGKSYTVTLRMQTIVRDGAGNISAGVPYSGGNLVVSLRWRFRSYESQINNQELGTEVIESSVATFTIADGVLNDETVTFSGTVPTGTGTILGLDNTYLKDVVVFSDSGTTANGKAIMSLDLRILP